MSADKDGNKTELKQRGMIVPDRSKIPEAIEYVQHAFNRFDKVRHTDPSEKSVVCVICEELLLHLLKNHHTDISVSVCLRRSPFVQITAGSGVLSDPGQPEAEAGGIGDSASDRIETKINRDLLDAYNDYISYAYKKGVHRYRIYTRKKEKEDPQDEIYRFYETADPALQDKPLSVLWYIAGHHKLFLILSLINRLIKHGAALMLPVLASGVIDDISAGMSFFSRPILLRIAASAVMIVLNLFCTWIESRQYHRFVRGIEAGFKMAITQKLHVLSMRYHALTPAGKLLTKLVSDVQFVGLLLFERLGDIIFLLEDIPYVIIVSLIKLPVMALFFVVVVPVDAFLLHRRMKPIWESKTVLRQETEASNAAFKEMLENERMIRSHGLEKTQDRSLASGVRNVRRASYRFDAMQIRLNNVGYGGAQGFRLLCLCITGFLAAKGSVSIGSVVLFLSLFDIIINSIQRVLDQMPQITQGYDSLVSINEVLFANDIEHNGTKLLPVPFRGGIELKNVVFGYSKDGPPLLDGVNMIVPPGKCVAVIGGSGSGKSTLLNLILGLYEKDSGEILVDGIDVNELEKRAYRRHLSVVPQQSILFSGTLLDNLSVGIPYISTRQVMDVLDQVGLSDFVSRHPEGLNMYILEGGENLSGGQRQRVAIARALLRDPKLIIFDEPTSALDSESEKQVQETIESLKGDCTVLIVAHRLNTIRGADLIYRIENKRAVFCDSFEQIKKETERKE